MSGYLQPLKTVTVAACALATSVTVAAAWIISTALSTNPNTQFEPVTIALDAADVSGPSQVSISYADVTFEARWVHVTVSASASVEPILARAADMSFESRWAHASGRAVPFVVPDELTKREIAAALVLALFANLSPATASAPTNPMPLAPKRTSERDQSTSLLGRDSRTAVYDISARTVYLPNGEKLEAHSGLGDKMDDPRYVNTRMRGPTPPNVYDLTLREELFHGVRAIRLNPVDDGKMFGRAGMLAHTYMLGSNGQSNGCVSFRDYQKFLQAFLSGEVDRLVVVPNLRTNPSRTARVRRGPILRYAFNNR